MNDDRTKNAREQYERKKEEVQMCVKHALHHHNCEVMNAINRTGDKKVMYKHLNGLMRKNKCKVKG